MKSIQVPHRIGLLAVLATMFACTEQELATAPSPKLEPPAPSLAMASLPSFSGALGVPGGASLTLPLYAAYPEGIKAVFTVTGQINVWSDPRANYFQETVNAGPGGVWIDGVYQQCSVGVRITYGNGSFGPPPCNPPGIIRHDPSSIWTFTAVVTGNGTAIRTPNIPVYHPGVCDTIVCHTYSGEHAVLVEPVQGELDLQAYYWAEPPTRLVRKSLFVHPFTNSTPWAYQKVIFTDSTTPRGLPMRPLSHVWNMADPTYPGGYWGHTELPGTCVGNVGANPPVYPSAYCPVNVKESGVYESRVRVNGVEHVESVTIYCSESETLLNNDLVRQQMLAVLDSSNAWSTNQAQVVERWFYIVLDESLPGSKPYVITFPRGPNDDICSGNAVVPTPSMVPPNTRVLAWGHDHPFDPATTPFVVCRDNNGRLNAFTPAEGASPEDRISADSVNSPTFNPAAQNAGWLPMSSFIIDMHNVYVLRPGGKAGEERNTGNMFNWDGLKPTDPTTAAGRCRWPKRAIL